MDWIGLDWIGLDWIGLEQSAFLLVDDLLSTRDGGWNGDYESEHESRDFLREPLTNFQTVVFMEFASDVMAVEILVFSDLQKANVYYAHRPTRE
jgi:hypothetical protein